jgi:hypothetical protein
MNRVRLMTFAVLASSTLLTFTWLILGARPWSRPSVLLDGAFWFCLVFLLSPYAILVWISLFSNSALSSLIVLVGSAIISFVGVGFVICETFSRPSLGDGFVALFVSALQWIGSGITAAIMLWLDRRTKA